MLIYEVHLKVLFASRATRQSAFTKEGRSLLSAKNYKHSKHIVTVIAEYIVPNSRNQDVKMIAASDLVTIISLVLGRNLCRRQTGCSGRGSNSVYRCPLFVGCDYAGRDFPPCAAP